jgi:hypothetical protein
MLAVELGQLFFHGFPMLFLALTGRRVVVEVKSCLLMCLRSAGIACEGFVYQAVAGQLKHAMLTSVWR